MRKVLAEKKAFLSVLRGASGALVLSAALIASGCGGGGGGGSPPPPPPTTVTGSVVQTAVTGATVHADKGPAFNGVKDVDEVAATGLTDANGAFTINVPAGYGEYRLVSTGGTDADGNPGITMLAPPLPAGQTTGIVSPLSSMMAVAADPTALSAALGITAQTNPVTTAMDPATLVLMKAMEAVMISLQQTAAQNPEVAASMIEAMAKKCADAVVANPAALNDAAALTSLVTTAADDAIADVEAAGGCTVVDAAALTAAIETNVTLAVNTMVTAYPLDGPNVSEGDLDAATRTTLKGCNDDLIAEVGGALDVQPPVDDEPPTTTPKTQAVAEGVQVTLKADEPADIYYTTDGSLPTTGSTKYTVPFVIDDAGTTRVTFFAVDGAGNAETPKYIDVYVAPTGSTGGTGGTGGGGGGTGAE